MNEATISLAKDIFLYLVQQDLLIRFLQQSGSIVDDLHNIHTNPELMAAILDFLLENEQDLINFCREQQCTPHNIWKHRLLLPGAPC